MPRRKTPNPLALAIGLRIKQLRDEQGMTAEKLAYESEVGSKGFMSDIEHGLAMPSLVTLDRLAQRLEVPIFDLLVDPTRSDRERMVDLTRRLAKGPLLRLLRELSESGATVRPKPPLRLYSIRAYSTLEVAAGWSIPASAASEPLSESVRLPGKFDRGKDFAVRASGNSMLGFRSSIRDGDWLVLRKASLSATTASGKVVLVAREDSYGDKSLHIKRVVETTKGHWFRSDDPAVKPMPVTERDRILATLVGVIAPESLAPLPETRTMKSEVQDVFGLRQSPSAPWSRVDGHLFFVLGPRDVKPSGLLNVKQCDPRPAETAFVLSTEGQSVRYVGIARFDEGRGQWKLRAEPRRS